MIPGKKDMVLWSFIELFPDHSIICKSSYLRWVVVLGFLDEQRQEVVDLAGWTLLVVIGSGQVMCDGVAIEMIVIGIYSCP